MGDTNGSNIQLHLNTPLGDILLRWLNGIAVLITTAFTVSDGTSWMVLDGSEVSRSSFSFLVQPAAAFQIFIIQKGLIFNKNHFASIPNMVVTVTLRVLWCSTFQQSRIITTTQPSRVRAGNISSNYFIPIEASPAVVKECCSGRAPLNSLVCVYVLLVINWENHY